jgi:hypothetical protein
MAGANVDFRPTFDGCNTSRRPERPYGRSVAQRSRTSCANLCESSRRERHVVTSCALNPPDKHGSDRM